MEHYFDLNHAVKAKHKDYHYLSYKSYDKAIHELSKGKKVTFVKGDNQFVSVTNHDDFYFFLKLLVTGEAEHPNSN